MSRLFERLVRDAQVATDLAAFRTRILAALADQIGADSASLMDPPGTRLSPSRARSRFGMLSMDVTLRSQYVAHKARYERSAERLVQAMEAGRPVIDSEILGRRERERLDLYAEILRPQGVRTLLCVFVHHRGRRLCQVTLKRHGRGATFRDQDAASLRSLLPAVALADAGFQHLATIAALDADPALGAGTRPLGSRETEVAFLVSKGLRNREIAMLIGTSCETVKKQVRSVFTKVGVSNRAELAGFLAGHRAS